MSVKRDVHNAELVEIRIASESRADAQTEVGFERGRVDLTLSLRPEESLTAPFPEPRT